MNYEQIEQYITQFPIYQYAMMPAGEIEFTDKVRTICKKECPRYGSSWSCPPAVGNLEKCKKKCQEYTNAMVFSSVAEVPDYSDMKQMLKTQNEHEQITRKIEKFLKESGVNCYTLSTESCSYCEKCTYPKKPCAHPELMHPCIESHGIVITNVLENYEMDYFMGENMVLWFSIIFMEGV